MVCQTCKAPGQVQRAGGRLRFHKNVLTVAAPENAARLLALQGKARYQDREREGAHPCGCRHWFACAHRVKAKAGG